MMNIKDFANEVAAMATGYTAEVRDIVKNNDNMLTGITFRKGDDSICPTVYVNSYFKKYCDGIMSLDEAAHDIEKVAEDAFSNTPFSLDADGIGDIVMNYSNAKKLIHSRLVNTGKNKKLLEELPHISLADLSIIFSIDLTENNDGISSIKVNDSILSKWGVDAEELLKVANENTTWQIKTMHETLMEIVREKGDFEMLSLLEATADEEDTMFVASNITKINGAAILADNNELERFSKAQDAKSFYILPSSIHELLFLPVNENEVPDVATLENMVREVNSTQVAPEDVLSDNVYFYDAEKKSVYRAFGNREEAVI